MSDEDRIWTSDYPIGQAGDLRVGFWRGDTWRFVPAKDRSEAEAIFVEALHRADLWQATIAGGHKGAVVWIAECRGGTEWARLKETTAAKEWLDAEGW